VPIYEYVCDACELHFERLRPMSAAGQPLDCPQCGGSAAAAVSRLARITGAAEGVGADDGFDTSAMPAGNPGHGHSHGPGGHSHPH
jgi:putative FmdB family regulatory protein